ncbi:AAA family ATPase [Oculatella sp. LEGE 06141]|uniref:AAA family ATPase n=1 Tax=Oculatella sp. LEGE 06141 TaxID=1828648 RepID=UPI00187E1471|nr:AAA family ATPase [Oculatella sp. LEGE 06141]MBE9177525.1 AAA family ATPase [Oculatella sp. LEGE 06141]
MPTDLAEGFADNWSYLKTELNWLDRMLMLAVARQRKETKDTDRLTHSRADRATSPWWKGVISLDGKIAYDEHRQPTGEAKHTYQQLLDAKIRVSQTQGVCLGLPSLRDRLCLTVFEKNLILMSLAPEINRRYARVYRFLQGEDAPLKTDLPTVDLVLRLLCRNDSEWRTARTALTSLSSPLIRHRLLTPLPCPTDTFLNYPLKLADALIDFLLDEQPTELGLESLLQPASCAPIAPQFLAFHTSTVTWADLVLPTALTTRLQQLSQRSHHRHQVDQIWGFGSALHPLQSGTTALLVGPSGTGKKTAAAAIAAALQVPLAVVDLAQVIPADYAQLLDEIDAEAPTVLLVKSAHLWLGRSAVLGAAEINQFLQERRRIAGLTLFSSHMRQSIKLVWQQQLDPLLLFPLPDAADRLRLWQQAFPQQVPLAADIDWAALAQHGNLSGGAITAIAREAAVLAIAAKEDTLQMSHIVEALAQKGQRLKRRSVASSTTAKRSGDRKTAKAKRFQS